jgi:hypothetical protein
MMTPINPKKRGRSDSGSSSEGEEEVIDEGTGATNRDGRIIWDGGKTRGGSRKRKRTKKTSRRRKTPRKNKMNKKTYKR